jgi:predicted RNase H-like nuclease
MRFLGIDLAWREHSDTQPANETGVAAIDPDGTVLDAGWCRGVDEVVRWINDWSGATAIAGVDASLLVTNPTGIRECERQVGVHYGRWKVAANPTNLASPRLAGVTLLHRLQRDGWRYDDGRDGPPVGGRTLYEVFPYVTLVGAHELGYAEARPRYKRLPKGMRIADFRPERAATCDDLISRLAGLSRADPPLDLESHPVTAALLSEPSPLADRDYKHREDLIDALLCSWTAALWWRHGRSRCQLLGEPASSRSESPEPVAVILAPARREQRAKPAAHGRCTTRMPSSGA